MHRPPRNPLPAKKRCRGRCGRVLALHEFNLDLEATDGRQTYCPRCKADSTREARWLRYYGLRPGRAQRCLDIQDNACPLCSRHLDFDVQSEAQWTLSVDHDHDTGEVRGFLHRRCNTSPPANAHASERWLHYCQDPPMRQAHEGVPLIAPVSGLGDAQMGLALEVVL